DFLRGDFARRGASINDTDIRRAASGTEPFVLRREDQRAFGVQVVSKDRKKLGTLVALYKDEQLQSSLSWVQRETRRQIAWACFFGACLGIALSVWLATYVLSPLQTFTATAVRVG